MAKKENKLFNGKHLTLSDRSLIESEIKKGSSLSYISQLIEKSPRTVSREIKTHLKVETNGRSSFLNKSSSDDCLEHLRFPYVCYACKKYKSGCINKYFYKYIAKEAQAEYVSTLSTNRMGVNFTEPEFNQVDQLVKEGTDKGQSVAVIIHNHKDEIPCSERSIYRHIENNILQTKNIDLKRKVTMKKRKKQYAYVKRDYEYLKGRTLEDFSIFLFKASPTHFVMMDLVEGKKEEGIYLLTIHFPSFKFMLAYKIIGKTAENVVNMFLMLRNELGDALYKKLFPVIVTDRGSEFKQPLNIEVNEKGEVLSHVFYCKPYSSCEKAEIERNHSLIRDILPKHTSFMHVTQEKAYLMMSHINSYPRESLEMQRPIDIFVKLFGFDVLEKLKVEIIDPDQVILKPYLLK